MPTYRPITWQPPIVQPIVVTGRQWYFGMSLAGHPDALTAPACMVASVTPGSPGVAGRPRVRGDTLARWPTQVSLQNAFSNEHGVQLLQSAVGGGAPAPTAAAAFVAPTGPGVLLTVINTRTQQPIHVTVRPQPIGGVPAPAQAAPAAPASVGTRLAPARVF